MAIEARGRSADRGETHHESASVLRTALDGNREQAGRTVSVRFDPRDIELIFAELDQDALPGAAVGIAIHGRPVFRRGFGLANMELPVLLSPSIRMRIGSTSKHFAALAYLLMCEDGVASVDDPIGKYLPEIHQISRGVTARQLMSHTSGLRDVHDISYQLSGIGRSVSTKQLFEMYRSIDDVNAAAGATWMYNNGGYVLLTVMIERISGESLENVLRKSIFEPLGMYDTMLRRYDSDFVPNSATLHMPRPDGAGFEKAHVGSAIAGEGGIVSTVDDMLRWLAHMDAPRIGSACTWNWLRESQCVGNGTQAGYSLGLMIGRYRGVETLSHAGGVLAGNSQMLKVPSAGLDLVIMVNRGDVYAMTLAERVLDACLPELSPIPTVKRKPNVTGVFRSAVSGRVIQLFADNSQQMVSIDGMDMPLDRDEAGVWWPAGIWSYLKQSIHIEGSLESPTAVCFTDFGNEDQLSPVRDLRQRDLESCVGQYHSSGTQTDVAISTVDCQLIMVTTGAFGSVSYQLDRLGDGILRAKPVVESFIGGVLSFDEDHQGFRLSTFRTSALPFRRVK